MAAITIRNLDDAFKVRLRLQAARHNRSMEEEARQLLRQGLENPSIDHAVRLTSLASSLFGRTHGLELALAPRDAPRPAPDWSK